MRQPDTETIEKYFVGSVDQFLLGQTLMVRAKWEPLVTADLAGISEQSWLEMRGLLIGNQIKRPGGSAAGELFDLLARTCARAAQAGIANAVSRLTEMVKVEGAELGDALTLGGLAGNAIGTEQFHPDHARTLAWLAGDRALEVAVTRSLADFLLRLKAELERTHAGQAQLSGLPQRLEELAASWRSRLAAVGRTAVHAAFNRTKRAISHRLA